MTTVTNGTGPSSTSTYIPPYSRAESAPGSPTPSIHEEDLQQYPDYLRLILTARCYEILKQTPLTHAINLSNRTDNKILFKREDLQDVFSFKIRGAYNKLAHLTEEEKRRGVIACSAGNHAQGVASAAKTMGIKATIVMPTPTPEIKSRNVLRLGSTVILHGKNFDEAKAECERLAKLENYTNIPPFDDPYVIAGQGTIGAEILRQHNLQEIDAIFCCVGGGGLISGVAAYVKRVAPHIKIIGCETGDANAMTRSLKAGRRIELTDVGLFADGAAVKVVGEEPFRLCQALVDEMVEVTNDEICAAIKDIFEDTRSIVEPAGGLAVAGCKKYLREHNMTGKTCIAVTSGANMNFERLRFVAERALLGEQKEALLSVVIPEKPGAFLQLYKHIHPLMVTEFSYRYAPHRRAQIYMSFLCQDRRREVPLIMEKLAKEDMQAWDISEDEMAKSHARYMIGGRSEAANERMFRFEFPERPGALLQFLEGLRAGWNVSLFHYRNHGSDMGKVLAGLQVPEEDNEEFANYLAQLNYHWVEETNNPLYKQFFC
ncbi:MAG: tryptophan synthase beta subunit-like PLP-dependent enzyme [Linnemannia gamsii]|nr:MAG: tryptophan synthase beta subunit-like PLP-dependent enzyme [Linnemannia gamsii]